MPPITDRALKIRQRAQFFHLKFKKKFPDGETTGPRKELGDRLPHGTHPLRRLCDPIFPQVYANESAHVTR